MDSQRQDAPREVRFDAPGTQRVTREVVHDDQHFNAVEVKNRVQWGPILAGVITALATMLLLTVLGLAIGASALEPRDVGERLGWGALIYGIISALISFFLGGWVAAKTAAVAGPGSGMINGLLVGATSLVLVLWLGGVGVGNALGAVSGNLGDIANFVQDQGVTTQDAQQAADDAQQQAQDVQSYENLRDGAWGTLAGLILPLAASAAGGVVGRNDREEIIQSGRAAHVD